MKSFLALTFLFLITVPTFAQGDVDEVVFYRMKAERYRKMKNAGTFLTVAGGILFVAGVVTLNNATYTTNYSNNGYATTSSSGNVGGGVLAVLAGTGALGAGVPLWIIGAHSERKYVNKLTGVTLGMHRNRNTTGMTLTYRF